MLLGSIFLAISAFAASPALALEFRAPRATNVAADKHDVIGFSPAPTTPPSPQDLRKRGLLQPRDTLTDTCGYADGLETLSYTCGIGSACIWNTVYDYFGCCSVDGSGEFILSDCPAVANPWTSCYPYSDANYCTGSCYTENRVCDSTMPYCAVAYLLEADATYTKYYCNSEEENYSLTLYSTFTDNAVATDTSATIPDNTDVVITTTVSHSPGTSSAINLTSSGSSKKKKTNVGAIAGGVVGGLAALAAIAGATILFLHKRKIAQRKQATMEVSQVGQ